jgi:chemotaxis signal transduction protein
MQDVNSTNKGLHLVVEIHNQKFAIPVTCAREMVAMPSVTNVPQIPDRYRGVINLRGKVLPLLDLRTHLGFPSCQKERQELIHLMHQREQDHKNWLTELRACVQENREFTLATDPRKCAFGKWYYSFDAEKASVRCSQLKSALEKFEEPHNRIHGVAKEVLQYSADRDQAAAIALIEETEGAVLSEMLELFADLRRLIDEETREIAVVLGGSQARVAVAVDTVLSVEHLELQDVNHELDTTISSAKEYVQGIAKRSQMKDLVLLLDTDKIIS